jgi:sec-independent protein translocase protein TatC
MSFLEHLVELRQRILVIALAVFVTGSVSYYFAFPILRILLKPAGSAVKLVYLGPLEPFMVKFKIAIFAGIALALPIILYEILAFVAPALKEKEKKLIYPVVFSLVVLFAGGVAFGYYFIMPPGTQWLLSQAEGFLMPNMTASLYVTYAGWFLLAMGISFETPVFLLLLVRLKVISAETLQKSWRYVILSILVIAAFLTPDWNPVNMIAMALPMIFFYLVSVVIARFI